MPIFFTSLLFAQWQKFIVLSDVGINYRDKNFKNPLWYSEYQDIIQISFFVDLIILSNFINIHITPKLKWEK